MELNEIKKALYKQKPTANLIASKTKISTMETTHKLYECFLFDGTGLLFDVPVSEMGAVEFGKEEPAQLLIRWMKLPQTKVNDTPVENPVVDNG